MSTSNATRIEHSRAVLVLGMHRSGTSVLSRALISLGVDFGTSLIAARPDNPRGFFEDKDIYALNQSFLRSMRCQWHSLILPKSYPLEAEITFRKQAARLIVEKFTGLSLWGLKDPRITRLLPYWEKVFSDMHINRHYILANRNPLEVANSLAKRNDMPTAHALALWALHQIDGLQAVINNGGMIVDYELMMTQPSIELRRLAEFLGQELESANKEIFLNDFLEQNLRHPYTGEIPYSGSPLIDACLSFNNTLLKLAQSATSLGHEEISEAEVALARAQRSIALHTDWFHAIDDIYLKVEDLRLRLQESNATIQSLQSDLAWLERKPLVKIARKLRDLLS
ncbi:MAG: hypothetical protein P8164_08940 [Gammaproteobacteria bacterium]